MISFEVKGSLSKTEAYLRRVSTGDHYRVLQQLAERGRAALANATPVDTGETANSWVVDVRKNGRKWEIVWRNTHVVNGQPIAILLQYGHGTGTGGYVQGQDYINPAIQPIFDQISEAVWREVNRA